MNCYYNEIDPTAAAWIRELIAEGLIPDGEVDTRSIVDIQPADLTGFVQCHFFAGIGGWSRALQLAGWSEDREVWTGSCPCQPFSVAGKGLGDKDDRHFWPIWRELIYACKPPIIFGEQVASSAVIGASVQGLWSDQANLGISDAQPQRAQVDMSFMRKRMGSDEKTLELRSVIDNSRAIKSQAARVWIDRVFDDLEGASYTCGAAIIPACAVNAPHIRQRLWWVAYAEHCRHRAECDSTAGRGETECGGAQREQGSGLGDTIQPGLEGHAGNGDDRNQPGRHGENTTRPTSEAGESGSRIWSDSIWHPCRDGKIRRIPRAQSGVLGVFDGLPEGVDVSWLESGFPLAKKIEGRAALLKGYGNAIVPQAAAEFVKAFVKTTT